VSVDLIPKLDWEYGSGSRETKITKKKNWKNVRNFMKVFNHQNMDLDPDPDSPRILDPDPKH
jgi:hypothetical protein